MKNLYQKAKKGARGIALAGLAALTFGCEDPQVHENSRQNSQVVDNSRYSFDSFGYIDGGTYGDKKMILADLDGDGDLDIAVFGNDNLSIYENKMPQKTRGSQ